MMMKRVTEITPRDAAQCCLDGVLLLDCREHKELVLARIEGALHIPMGDIPSRQTELDPDRPTIVFCHKGARSYKVAAFLLEQGFTDVKSMAGGIDAWSAQVDASVPRY
ncbi:MAG: hypothetical protein AMXMBFR47_28010 [Planctomycetota bacterium]